MQRGRTREHGGAQNSGLVDTVAVCHRVRAHDGALDEPPREQRRAAGRILGELPVLDGAQHRGVERWLVLLEVQRHVLIARATEQRSHEVLRDERNDQDVRGRCARR